MVVYTTRDDLEVSFDGAKYNFMDNQTTDLLPSMSAVSGAVDAKAYEPPTIEVLGRLEEMTEGGGGGDFDPGSGNFSKAG